MKKKILENHLLCEFPKEMSKRSRMFACSLPCQYTTLYLCRNSKQRQCECDDWLTQLKNICALLPSYRTMYDVRTFTWNRYLDRYWCCCFRLFIRSYFFGVAKRAAEKITDTHARLHVSTSYTIYIIRTHLYIDPFHIRNIRSRSDKRLPESARKKKRARLPVPAK